MWPFSSTRTSSGSEGAALSGGSRTSSSSDARLDPHSMEVPQDANGVSSEVPVIAYTEKVIAEKEASLRKYIQDNYDKLHAVEKELEALRMEVKLTSGSKKAALEHLRQKIEESSDRIKAARAKEIQAKQVWEAAVKVVEQEEEHKKTLCEDLRVMIQESAMQQFERLEALTQKLDALNPEMRGVAISAIEGLRAQIAPHGAPLLTPASVETSTSGPRAPAEAVSASTDKAPKDETSGPEQPREARGAAAENGPSTLSSDCGHAERNSSANGATDPAAAASAAEAQGGVSTSQSRGGSTKKPQLKGGGKGKGPGLVTKGGQQASGPMGLKGGGQGGWTGAGFDVQ